MKRLATLLSVVSLAGCASVPGGNPADPFEGWNRKVYAFNDTVDNAVVKPVAETYRDTVPQLVRRGVDNVLGNIGDAWSSLNHFLQGKGQVGLEMGMRVLTNTLFGLGGLLDPASEMGLTRRSEDFGQTLGRWGVGPGPFIVLPLFGPSNLRDTFGFVADQAWVAPTQVPRKDAGRFAVGALELINTRANLLGTTGLVDQVALDRYSFIRDAYLQRRLDLVHDGAPPMEQFEDEPADPPPK